MSENIPEIQEQRDDFDLRTIIGYLRAKWYYFVFFVLLGVIGAIAYVKFTLPVYEAQLSILLKDSKHNSSNIESYIATDFFGVQRNMATEIGILQSKSLIKETVNELPIRVSYFQENPFNDEPIYKNLPFEVEIIDQQFGLNDSPFKLSFIDDNKFKLTRERPTFSGEFKFGQQISAPGWSIIINKTDWFTTNTKNKDYIINVNSQNRLINTYSGGLRVEPLNRDASIVLLTFRDIIPDRAIDFLNALGQEYINLDIRDKTSIATLTLKFIEEQMGQISETLGGIENELLEYKKEKGTVNLSAESLNLLQRLNQIDVERAKLDIEIKTLDYLDDYVRNHKDISELAPSSMGIPDPLLTQLIQQYQTLQTKRQRLAYGTNASSPVIQMVDNELEEVRKSLLENISVIKNKLNVAYTSYVQQISGYEAEIKQIPLIERELISIQRKFEVNQDIYVYLLQKKAETSIAKATAVSDNKILDSADYGVSKVKPNAKTVLGIGLALGLAIPILIIFLQNLLKTTISNRDEIVKLSKIPVLGVVGHLKKADNLVVFNHPKSSIAEAFRSVRTNLQFLEGNKDDSKIVVITSSVSNEGKSFTTINLATILALQGNRVIIIGMDLRKPKLYKDLNGHNRVGVSNYLIGKATVEEIKQKTVVENLDLIAGGPVPPNPSELLSSDRVKNLFDELKKNYDYLIIDTPPIGIVTDAVTITQYSDVNVFMVRENFSRKEYLASINELYEEGKIKNLGIILNDSRFSGAFGYYYGSGYGYGYGYGNGYSGNGYGYYQDEPNGQSIFKKLLNKN